MLLTLFFSLILNFGKTDDHVYRGAQIQPSDIHQLQELGISVVINLRKNEQPWEKSAVEAAGMRYYHFPMSSTSRPKLETVNAVFALMKAEKEKVFVHCASGRHRTGLIIAVWRIREYHWTFDQVYEEMKLYDYYSGLTHGAIKSFVRDLASSP